MVRPAKAFTAEQASEKDLEIIEAQLGRTPRDVLAIAHRCPCGAPDVVQKPHPAVCYYRMHARKHLNNHITG